MTIPGTFTSRAMCCDWRGVGGGEGRGERRGGAHSEVSDSEWVVVRVEEDLDVVYLLSL